MVAMFFSEAGARPWTWEASPSEHKKWVEIEADFAMSSVNPNASGILLEEFLSIVRKKKEVRLHWNEIRHIFTAFDRHYRGYLTLEDFKTAFKQVAPKLSERTVLDVFSRQFPVRIHFPFGKSLSDLRFFGHNSSFTSLSLPTVINP
ncbi:EF-hand calcium-binding domain-containing protein 11 isoform X5 [Mustela putorius furo]|uniref:EF-hand calcium-binding domain-containing protein 11 isoform X5 n=1 Tax=Mustela putorius furo TaxID=9669 RepID=A0A8U0UTX4_MUSPF|nr:EF-hand calcium-binding domain-containing protein 11 isoform X5 [Mustela putorius furo]